MEALQETVAVILNRKVSHKEAAAAVTAAFRTKGHDINVSPQMVARAKDKNPSPPPRVDPRNVDPRDIRVTNPSGHPTALPRAFEQQLLDWIAEMERIHFPPTKAMFMKHVNHLIEESQFKTTLVDNKVDMKWVTSFMKRYDLRCFRESPMESVRIAHDQSCNSEVMYTIFDDVAVEADVAVYNAGHGPGSKPKSITDERITITKPHLIVRYASEAEFVSGAGDGSLMRLFLS